MALQLADAESPRKHLSLDASWGFHSGDVWPDALHLKNSGTGSGPTWERFSMLSGVAVNVQHDWAAHCTLSGRFFEFSY